MHLRLFIAIELSNEIRTELEGIQEKLKQTSADVKWVKPQNVHLTLKFLGNVKMDDIPKIKNVLQDIAEHTNPFNIALSEIGAFPNLNSPRVIWVGLKDGVAESAKITNEIEEGLAILGFPKEQRPFSAHLTLGRLRSLKNRDKLIGSIEAINKNTSRIPRPTSSVSYLTLFQSTLTPKGPIYTALHRSNLAKI